MQSSGLSLTLLVTLAASAAACAVPVATESDPAGSEAQRIQGGLSAASYPEAVLIDVWKGGVAQPGCSGALVGPRTVLTSGRCATQFDGWTVRAPFASGQTAQGVSSAVYDFDRTADAPSTTEHDIGLIFLGAPIALSVYPQLATGPLAAGAEVVGVGRVLDGQASSSTLYASEPLAAADASGRGFLYDYAATGAIEHGDSGGPDFLLGTHTIMAVNDGSVDGTALLARVDLVSPWIQYQLSTAVGGGVVEPGWPEGPGEPGEGHGDGHGDGHGGGQGDGHGGGQGDGHGGGQGDGHGGGGQGQGHGGGGQGQGHGGGGQGSPGGGHH